MKFSHRLYQALIRTLVFLQPKPPAALALEARHLSKAILVPDRKSMLEKLPKGGKVMECGVDNGLFSEQILEICAPEELMLVDTWGSARFSERQMNNVAARFSKEIAAGIVKICRNTSRYALRSADTKSLSWVYLDTSHDYNTTKEELLLAAECVKSDGYICGHDYTLGSWNSFIRYGVIEAVNEFCVTQDWEFIYLTNEPNRNLSFALRRADEL